MDFKQALGIVRLMINGHIDRETAINNLVIPVEFRQEIRQTLEKEDNIIFEPARILVSNTQRDEWLQQHDRLNWYYWQNLRNYLLGVKNWSEMAIRSLDETTDRILGQLEEPKTERFDIRGLVVGYVQSGKTANFTALIAKAVDTGYRLIIVLSGTDNGLRRQTQIRLNKELAGYQDNRPGAVPLPPMGKRWLQFTNEEQDGDFRPGFANHAALQGTQPILLVIKKNGSVLRRLHRWLEEVPEDMRGTISALIIDDEADQASIDTRGSYQAEDEPLPDDYEDPSAINGLIRGLLQKFPRHAYVGYTATPFANILIPHDTFAPHFNDDLYPKDFIVDLPKPSGYFGAEEQFGRFDWETGEEVGGMDIIRNVPVRELDDLKRNGVIPPSLGTAMLDFVLAGAARAQRGQGNASATMLLHGSHLVLKQAEMASLVDEHFKELKNEWRYQRHHALLQKLQERWEQEFRPVTQENHLNRDVAFAQIEPCIGPFFEAVQIRVINSQSGDVLDYEREPGLKTIAIGGNRLSRGLTLEGLLTSYFFRSSAIYDTLMQMGRWFGFRDKYEDLTRIYMTSNLAGWFSDLSLVEYELRQDIKLYEAYDVTPLELGARILKHPAMLVTNRLKQRNARTIILEQSYSNQVMQTFRFPFQRLDDLSNLLGNNLEATRKFLSALGEPDWSNHHPLWNSISPDKIMEFLQAYQIDQDVRNINLPLLVQYIQSQYDFGELSNWTVAVRGRETNDATLGNIDLGIGQSIPMISRNRLAGDPDSLGVITNPGDEEIGLTQEQIKQAKSLRESSESRLGQNPAARLARPSTDGLLLIYPVSHFSGHERQPKQSRRPMYDNPNDALCRDVICFAISFPKTEHDQGIRGEYVIGTVDSRPL